MVHILENCRLFMGGADYTAQSNKVEIAAESEEKEVTTFGSVDANGKLWKDVIGCAKGGPPDLSENTGARFRSLLQAKRRA